MRKRIETSHRVDANDCLARSQRSVRDRAQRRAAMGDGLPSACCERNRHIGLHPLQTLKLGDRAVLSTVACSQADRAGQRSEARARLGYADRRLVG